jgi:hypothetical protein
MEELDPVEVELASMEEERAGVEQEAATVRQALAAAEAVVDDQVASVRAERETLVAGVPADLAATYERLRAKLGGVGAARLVGSSCSGCHLTLPATELDRLRHAPPGEVAYCDQCGRILVVG